MNHVEETEDERKDFEARARSHEEDVRVGRPAAGRPGEEDDFPLRLYEYTAAGGYGFPVRLNNSAELEFAMKTTVRRAIAEKREIRITDTGDMLVFHAQDGAIVFPTPGQIAGTEKV